MWLPILPNPCAVMLRGAAGASLVAARERKRASKNAKRGGASRALAALGRSARQPFTAEAHAQLRDAIIAVQTDWSDAHGRVSKAALCEADEDAVEDAQKACHTLREEGGMGWMARVRVVKRGNRHWEEDSAVLHHQLVGMVCDGRTAGAGGMQIDDHWKIVGTGFNTDPKDAACKNGRWRLCVRLCLAQATAHVGAACIARAAPTASQCGHSVSAPLASRAVACFEIFAHAAVPALSSRMLHAAIQVLATCSM